MKELLPVPALVVSLALTGCASPAAGGATQTVSPDLVATMAAGTLQALPSDTPQPTTGPACREAGPDTVLLTNEEYGYCFLHPAGYARLDPLPYEVCLVPEGPAMTCHSANLIVEVQEASGRTSDQVAAEIVAEAEAAAPGIEIERTTLTVGGEEAVALDGLPGQASARTVLIVHAGQLYSLTFLPWDEAGDEFAQLERLYSTVIDSLGFLP